MFLPHITSHWDGCRFYGGADTWSGHWGWVGLQQAGTRNSVSASGSQRQNCWFISVTSAGGGHCCPLSWRPASESTVSRQPESSFASKVTSGIQTKGSQMMPTGHFSLLRSDKGWASHLCSRTWGYSCCEKMLQFRELPLKRSTIELGLSQNNCLPFLSSERGSRNSSLKKLRKTLYLRYRKPNAENIHKCPWKDDAPGQKKKSELNATNIYLFKAGQLVQKYGKFSRKSNIHEPIACPRLLCWEVSIKCEVSTMPVALFLTVTCGRKMTSRYFNFFI